MAKQKTLLERAASLSPGRLPFSAWLATQPKDMQQQLLDLRDAYQRGEIAATAQSLVDLIKEDTGCKHGYEAIRKWLKDTDR